jgi:hypothetical protein
VKSPENRGLFTNCSEIQSTTKGFLENADD